ncbi:hypothetical protein JZ751_020467 [Albula glossodonta]|uniref:Ig-like domain-containing protein n=1 Tax=Albula glossodonta TaxID=121402 RepID=A0A8T2PHV1_9TELE|nr:hypothetical protein JZ751_020467 [Albula glossodonta]
MPCSILKASQSWHPPKGMQSHGFEAMVSDFVFCEGVLILLHNAVNAAQAFFGEGTKLTVLEHNVTNPKVKILHPSKNEIEEKKHVTLVCVAYDFYPDHIDIKWGINGVDVTKSSTMDDSARLTESNKKYIISSRLKITKSVWLSSRNEFSCKVEFYNGSKTVTYPDLIKGAPCE